MRRAPFRRSTYRWSSRPSARSRGQALVEFAIIVPIFFEMIFGLIDCGRGVYSYNTISQAAREGARLAAVQASYIGKTGAACAIPVPDITPAPASACPTNTADFKARVVSAVNRMSGIAGPISNADVTVTCNGGPCTGSTVTGDTIRVQIRYRYNLFTPVVAQLVPSVDMSASAAMAAS